MIHRGIYPGTFDPVHRGHEAFALGTMQACRLDEIAFLPEPLPRNKPHVLDIEHRIAMLQLMKQDHPSFTVHHVASDQFTISDTWPEIQRMWPDATFTLLIGSDVLSTLHQWPRIAEFLPHIALAIGMRGNTTQSDIDATMHQLIDAYTIPIPYTCIHTSYAHDASSRSRYTALHTASLHPAVEAYIHQHHCYPDAPPCNDC